MKAATNIAIIAALLALAFFASGAVSGFAGVALLFFLLGKAMDFYALPESEKKKDDQFPDVGNMVNETPLQKSAPLPADTDQVSTGSATEGITTGERYYRNDEQASSGDYTNPDAPADTVQVANVDAAAKPGKTFELEMI